MRGGAKRTKRKNTYKRKKSASKQSAPRPSGHNSIPECVKLFTKYKLTSVAKLVKWMNYNHTDKALGRGSKQSSKLQDDYMLITGCFAQRKKILKLVLASKKSTSKSKSTSKTKKKLKPFALKDLF